MSDSIWSRFACRARTLFYWAGVYYDHTYYKWSLARSYYLDPTETSMNVHHPRGTLNDKYALYIDLGTITSSPCVDQYDGTTSMWSLPQDSTLDLVTDRITPSPNYKY